MSTNNGVAPRRVIEETVEKKVNGVVMTASPGPTPSAINANSSASLPEATPTAMLQPRNAAISLFELAYRRTEDELLGFGDRVDGSAHLGANRVVLSAQVNDGNLGTGIRHWS